MVGCRSQRLTRSHANFHLIVMSKLEQNDREVSVCSSLELASSGFAIDRTAKELNIATWGY